MAAASLRGACSRNDAASSSRSCALEPALAAGTGRHRAAVRVGDDAADEGRDVQPHHLRARCAAAGARAVRARPRAGRAGDRGRRAGGGADPGRRQGARLRCLCRQPAQMDAGAEGHRLHVPPAGRSRSASGRRSPATSGTTTRTARSASCSTAPAACRWSTAFAALRFIDTIGMERSNGGTRC